MQRWTIVLWSMLLASCVANGGEPSAGDPKSVEGLFDGLEIVRRGTWGARAGRRCVADRTPRDAIAIHHTAGPRSQTTGQIQDYHLSKGWCDVAYHFLIDEDGIIYEGRPLSQLGRHVGRQNSGRIGVAFIGCFDAQACPPQLGPSEPPEAMLEAGARLLGELEQAFPRLHLGRDTVRGHKEHPGHGSNACPGESLRSKIDQMLDWALEGPEPLRPMALHWEADTSGVYEFRIAAPSDVTRVKLRVDSWEIGDAPRQIESGLAGFNNGEAEPSTPATTDLEPPRGTLVDWPYEFLLTHRFSVARSGRRVEAIGFDAEGRRVARANGSIDIGNESEPSVAIRQVGVGVYDFALERRPEGAMRIAVGRDGGEALEHPDGDPFVVRRLFAEPGEYRVEIQVFGDDIFPIERQYRSLRVR